VVLALGVNRFSPLLLLLWDDILDGESISALEVLGFSYSFMVSSLAKEWFPPPTGALKLK